MTNSCFVFVSPLFKNRYYLNTNLKNYPNGRFDCPSGRHDCPNGIYSVA